jgi:hypothetical protein
MLQSVGKRKIVFVNAIALSYSSDSRNTSSRGGSCAVNATFHLQSWGLACFLVPVSENNWRFQQNGYHWLYVCLRRKHHKDFLPLEPLTCVTSRGLADKMPWEKWRKMKILWGQGNNGVLGWMTRSMMCKCSSGKKNSLAVSLRINCAAWIQPPARFVHLLSP